MAIPNKQLVSFSLLHDLENATAVLHEFLFVNLFIFHFKAQKDKKKDDQLPRIVLYKAKRWLKKGIKAQKKKEGISC